MENIEEQKEDSLAKSSNQHVEMPAKRKRSKAFEVVETVFIALVLAILIRATLAEARYIPSGSMRPTLVEYDRLIVEKVAYYFTSPQRGDILVFYPPQRGETLDFTKRLLRWFGFTGEAAYIKRVVGLPGETIEIKDGQVLIDGKRLEEGYIYEPPFYSFAPLKIPQDSYFMMGDNRNNSEDSHKWGPLPQENIIGRAVFRFWPLARIGPPS